MTALEVRILNPSTNNGRRRIRSGKPVI